MCAFKKAPAPPVVGLGVHLDCFVAHLGNAGLAPGSIRSYFLALRRFSRWLGERAPDGATVNAYVRHLQTDLALRPRSIRPACAAIKQFLEWCEERGHISQAPPRIRKPPLDKPSTYCPTAAEVSRIWAWADALPQATLHQRYVKERTRTVLALLLWAGLRHSELQALDVSDVDLDRRELRIRCGKGGHTDTLPLASVDLFEQLSRFVELRAEWVDQHQPYPEVAAALFHIDCRRRIGDANNREMWAALNAAVSPASPIRDHACRRYFATSLCRNGVALADVSRLMRHRSLQTTLVYLYSDQQSVNAAAATLGRERLPDPSPVRLAAPVRRGPVQRSTPQRVRRETARAA